MCRLNFHDSMNHRDRALHKAYLEFDQICKQNLNLPPTINKIAQGYYKKIAESQLTRGAVRSGIKANCVFFACKEAKVPRTTQEMPVRLASPPKTFRARTTLSVGIFN